MNREELQALMDAPFGASRLAGAALKANGQPGRRDPEPAGYAGTPGKGPPGETCGTCRHLAGVRHARVYRKCGLMRGSWTGGRKTDVKVRSPACVRWVPRDIEPEAVL